MKINSFLTGLLILVSTVSCEKKELSQFDDIEKELEKRIEFTITQLRFVDNFCIVTLKLTNKGNDYILLGNTDSSLDKVDWVQMNKCISISCYSQNDLSKELLGEIDAGYFRTIFIHENSSEFANFLIELKGGRIDYLKHDTRFKVSIFCSYLKIRSREMNGVYNKEIIFNEPEIYKKEY